MWAHGMAHKMLNGRLTGGSYIVMIEKWHLLTLPFYLALATFHTQDKAAVKVTNRILLLRAQSCQKTSSRIVVFFGVDCEMDLNGAVGRLYSVQKGYTIHKMCNFLKLLLFLKVYSTKLWLASLKLFGYHVNVFISPFQIPLFGNFQQEKLTFRENDFS